MIDVIRENTILKYHFIALLEELEKEINQLNKKDNVELSLKNYLIDLRKYITDALIATVEGVVLNSEDRTKGILKDLLDNEV